MFLYLKRHCAVLLCIHCLRPQMILATETTANCMSVFSPNVSQGLPVSENPSLCAMGKLAMSSLWNLLWLWTQGVKWWDRRHISAAIQQLLLHHIGTQIFVWGTGGVWLLKAVMCGHNRCILSGWSFPTDFANCLEVWVQIMHWKPLAGIFLVFHSEQQALWWLLKLMLCVALIFACSYSSAKIIYKNACKMK